MLRWALISILIVLAGCTSVSPLSKDAPVPATADALVRPPWEAYVKAGPGAENEVDMETLTGKPDGLASPPQPPFEMADASTAAPDPAPVANAPAPKTAPPTEAKPGQVAIKAVAVLPVTGGSAKGDAELTKAMRKVLAEAGWQVLSKARADALSIQGHFSIDPALAGQQMVHLRWVVTTPAGKNLGDVKQDNAVPDGSLNAGWGENAGFAAQGAAEGISKLIEKYR